MPMTLEQAYEVLGVASNATDRQVEVAYRRKAQQVHPDRIETVNHERMNAVADAFELIKQARKEQLASTYITRLRELFNNQANITPELLEGLNNLIEQGIHVDTTDPRSGCTAVYFAVLSDNIDAVKAYVARGANLNVLTRRDGSSPLFEAKSKAVVRELVLGGADLLLANRNGLTAIKQLLNKKIVSADELLAMELDKGGFEGPNRNVIRALLLEGANINRQGTVTKRTLAHLIINELPALMAQEGKKAQIEALMGRLQQCDLSIPDANGQTPLQLLESRGLREPFEAFKAANQPQQNRQPNPPPNPQQNQQPRRAPVFEARGEVPQQQPQSPNERLERAIMTQERKLAMRGSLNLSGIEAAINQGADPNVQSAETGWTALHLAAGSTSEEALAFIEGLIGKPGVDFNLRTKNSTASPLFRAATMKIAEALVRGGGDLWQTNKHGKRAFDNLPWGANPGEEASRLLAIELNKQRVNLDLIKALIEKGADPNTRSQRGWTALHWAAGMQGGLQFIEGLVGKAGVDFNLRTHASGVSPLGRAKDMKTVEALVRGGVDLLQIDNDGGRALDQLPWGSHPEREATRLLAIELDKRVPNVNVIKALIGKGADINTPSEKAGLTVVHAAALLMDAGFLNFLKAQPDIDCNRRARDGRLPLEVIGGDRIVTVAEKKNMIFRLVAAGANPVLENSKNTQISLDLMARGFIGIPDLDFWMTRELEKTVPNANIIEAFVAAGADRSPLYIKMSQELSKRFASIDAALVRTLLKAGVDPMSEGNNGRSALVFFIEKGDVDAIRFIAEKTRVDFNLRVGGVVPLEYAHTLEMVSALISAGANPLLRTQDNYSTILARLIKDHVVDIDDLLVEELGKGYDANFSLVKELLIKHRGQFTLLDKEKANGCFAQAMTLAATHDDQQLLKYLSDNKIMLMPDNVARDNQSPPRHQY